MLSFWRDLSVVWLSLFCFIGLAIPLAILYFAVRGMNALHDKSFQLLRRAQQTSHRIPKQTEQLANRVSEPVIALQKRTKRMEAFLDSLMPDEK